MKRVVLILLLIFVFTFATISDVMAENFKTITDMVGREVKVPKKIERVVTTYKSATQFIFSLGAQEKLVAVDIGSPRQKLFIKLMPGIKELPTVGSKRHGLNLEEIISVKPDLVVLFPYKDGPVVAEKLAKQGIASIIIKPESLEEIRETNLLLGEVLGLKEKARKIDRQYERILDHVAGLTGIPENEKKVVYFANSELFDTVGKGMLQTSMIELSGGINPASETKSGFVRISGEQLIKWNPDIIIVSQFFQGNINNLKNKKEYQAIKAFSSGKIYRIPSELEPWDFPSPSSYLAVLWLADKIYPEKLAGFNLNTIIDEFYKTLYGRKYSQLVD